MLKVKLEGLDELHEKLGDVAALNWSTAAFKAAGEHVISKTSKYPPESDANKPKSEGGWYERGYGSKYKRQDGGITSRKTSEMLGKRWKSKPAWLQVEVSNPVSYAEAVHGEKQAKIHGKRGWKKLEETAKDEMDVITKLLQKQLDRILDR